MNPSIGGPGGEEVTWPPGAVSDRLVPGTLRASLGYLYDRYLTSGP